MSTHFAVTAFVRDALGGWLSERVSAWQNLFGTCRLGDKLYLHGIINSTTKICRELRFDQSSLHRFAAVQDGTALLMLGGCKMRSVLN